MRTLEKDVQKLGVDEKPTCTWKLEEEEEEERERS
jgi:hypothetical protein